MSNVVLQQVSKASLLVDNVDKWVSIDAGIIVYVAFTKSKEELSDAKLLQLVNNILSLGIIFSENWKENRSVLDERADILIIPQASLSGKLKGKKMQYHSLIEKKKGDELYSKFCDLIKKTYEEKLSITPTTTSTNKKETKESGKSEETKQEETTEQSSHDNNKSEKNENNNDRKPQVQCGVYGNRQGLKFESRGPFTHVLLGTDD